MLLSKIAGNKEKTEVKKAVSNIKHKSEANKMRFASLKLKVDNNSSGSSDPHQSNSGQLPQIKT